jgi:hypothetical protein
MRINRRSRKTLPAGESDRPPPRVAGSLIRLVAVSAEDSQQFEGSGGRFEVTLLRPHMGIIAVKSNPVHSLTGRI